jgi:serine/threonine-protein kinase RsbW
MHTSFSTVCAREKLSDIRRFLHQVLAKVDVAEAIKQEIVLAVDEACANAMIHGNQCDAHKLLQLDVSVENNQLIVHISDIGDFEQDLASHQDKGLDELIRQRRRGGLGLKLIYTIMDTVAYSREGTRNVCTLTKNLPQSPK